MANNTAYIITNKVTGEEKEVYPYSTGDGISTFAEAPTDGQDWAIVPPTNVYEFNNDDQSGDLISTEWDIRVK